MELSSVARSEMTAAASESNSNPKPNSEAPNNEAKIRDAASQFEALLINEMLKSASTSGEGSWISGEDGQDSTMSELGQQQFAQALANQGGLGLAKMVVAGLDKSDKAESGKGTP